MSAALSWETVASLIIFSEMMDLRLNLVVPGDSNIVLQERSTVETCSVLQVLS